MNFKKLQAMQAKLDEAILADKAPMTTEERFNKTLVALSVEIAEVANCAEHFKFWKDNKGKVDDKRFNFYGLKRINEINPEPRKMIDENNGDVITIEQAHRLTLIEECSDALHFILSLANQNDFRIYDVEYQSSINAVLDFPLNRRHSLESNYLGLQNCIQKVSYIGSFMCGYSDMVQLVANFTIYYEKLGITPQELEQAYYDKNKINYERLENGY
ncbi:MULTISPECIES: dUTP diphosphatase [Lactobacillales]|uniref:dUTP diphosphatase n=1 Tax=Lactobacillales TaxID=186826 RepID=UPI00026C8682|nr:dUTP diphosphatase [Carnobacterium maltaromaticum]